MVEKNALWRKQVVRGSMGRVSTCDFPIQFLHHMWCVFGNGFGRDGTYSSEIFEVGNGTRVKFWKE